MSSTQQEGVFQIQTQTEMNLQYNIEINKQLCQIARCTGCSSLTQLVNDYACPLSSEKCSTAIN